MPNKNYRSGRRFEYAMMEHYRGIGYKVVRTAGSHGEFDIIAYHDDHVPNFVQCKAVSRVSAGRKCLEQFKATHKPSVFMIKTLVVKVKGSKEVYDFQCSV